MEQCWCFAMVSIWMEGHHCPPRESRWDHVPEEAPSRPWAAEKNVRFCYKRPWLHRAQVWLPLHCGPGGQRCCRRDAGAYTGHALGTGHGKGQLLGPSPVLCHIWWFSQSPISFSIVIKWQCRLLFEKKKRKFPAFVVTEISWKMWA